MPYHLRFQSQSWATHHITSRCLQGFDLLKPTPQVNAVIRGALCYSAHLFKDVVHLHYMVFLSNHFHLILSAHETGDLSDFMKHFKGNLARELNRLHNRTGTFWEKRFSSEEILDEGALRDAIKYLTQNSVKEGLVNHPSEWTGIHSYHQLVEGKTLKGSRLDRSALTETRAKSDEKFIKQEDFTTEYTLDIKLPPTWSQLGVSEYTALITHLSEEAIQEAVSCRKNNAMGMDLVLAQDINKPRLTKRSIRPLCRTSCLNRFRQYKVLYNEFKVLFQNAILELRSVIMLGNSAMNVVFPKGGVPPLWSRGYPPSIS